MIPHINTKDGITIVLFGRPYHVDNTNERYLDILEAVEFDWSDEEILEVIESTKRKVEEATRLTPSLQYSGGIVTRNDEELRGYAIDKLVGLIEADKPAAALVNFLDKLQNNPSTQTREDLYAFLEHGKMPITEDGNFLAYKAIRKDWTDIHSSQFDNSIGSTHRMPRAKVDDRRENTCSTGFHVCSFDYLPHFSHADGHVVVCEINPADVVSIPADYNNTKMRVSEYTVIGEIEDYYQDKNNVLSSFQVFSGEYEVYSSDQDKDWEHVATCDELDGAKDYAEDEVNPVEGNRKFSKVTRQGVTLAFFRQED